MGISMRFIPDINIVLMVFLSFIVFIVTGHILAYLLRYKYITKYSIFMMEYVYTTFAVLGILGIMVFEINILRNHIENNESYMNRVFNDIHSSVDFHIEYFCLFDFEMEVQSTRTFSAAVLLKNFFLFSTFI